MELRSEVLALRTRHAFNIAREVGRDTRYNVWVRLVDAEGREGWGEAPATPYYGETAEIVGAALPRLGSVLSEVAGDDPFQLERIEAALEESLGRNSAARVAVSAALHDLVGKRLGEPLWRVWGLDPAAAPVSSFTIGIDDLELMREKVQEAESHPILKIKVGTPDDEAILGMIREEAPEKIVRVDANTGWSVKEAIAALPMLEEYEVELIEQPLVAHDIEGLRLLRERSSIPIIADESCSDLKDIAALVGAVDGINIKLTKCGSLREAIRMVHAARAHGMSVMLGCMIESTLGIAAAIQLAPLVDYVDLDGAALLANDPFTGPGIDENGRLQFNEAPGLGVTKID